MYSSSESNKAAISLFLKEKTEGKSVTLKYNFLTLIFFFMYVIKLHLKMYLVWPSWSYRPQLMCPLLCNYLVFNNMNIPQSVVITGTAYTREGCRISLVQCLRCCHCHSFTIKPSSLHFLLLFKVYTINLTWEPDELFR